MKKVSLILIAALFAALSSCSKSETYESPKFNDVSLEIEENSVCFSAKVNFIGKANLVLDIATMKDMSDLQQYEMTKTDDYSYAVNVKNLDENQGYWYRITASNDNFTISTEIKPFTITTDLLKYDEGYGNYTRVGKPSGGKKEWAVMFPVSMLEGYTGGGISKVTVVVGEEGDYTVRIYKGGTKEPTSLVKTKAFEAAEDMQRCVIEFLPISFSTSEPLWISIVSNYEPGQYPAVTGTGCNNANARWTRDNDGAWKDASTLFDPERDISWLISATVVYIDNEGKRVESELSPYSGVEHAEHIMDCAE